MKRILAATDLSERSERALRQAIHLASAQNAALHVLYVVDEDIPRRIANDIISGATENLKEQIAQVPDGKSVNASIHVEWLCCINPARDSCRESSVVAGGHEQTYTADLQDQELARLQ